MVKVWGKEERGETTCKNCGAVYKVTVYRFPMRDSDHYDCAVCGERLATWNDTEAPSFELLHGPEGSESPKPL